MSPGVQVYNPQSLHTTHPQKTVMVDNGTNTSCYITASLKRLFNLTTLKIIEEQACITSYPQTVIDGIDGKCTNKARHPLIIAWQFQA